MISEADILKKINNLIQVGTISEVKSDQALARVDLMGRVTDFLPVLSQSNAFKKHYIPARVSEQVVVLSPFGEASGGLILRGVFNKQTKEPSANTSKEVEEYEDGTKISYDSQAKELKVEASDKIIIVASGDIIVTCSNANITATTTHNGNVSINGDLSVSGNITDSRGDLTGHSHSDSDGATSLPR